MKTRHKLSALLLMAIFTVSLFTSCMSSSIEDEYVQAFNDGGLESFAHALFPVTPEEVEALSPINHQQAEYIDNLPRHPDGENWVVFMYVCGSNLESQGNFSLSDTVLLQNSIDSFEEDLKKRDELPEILQQLKDFNQVQKENNLSLPESFYEKELAVYYETTTESEDDPFAQMEVIPRGVASTDLMHITSVKLPENITFIIQTGGANHWDYPGVNPNLIQRWKFDHTGLTEIYSGPVENMGSPEGLTSFLEFSKPYYGDHNAFFFWNHGAGAFGAEHDEIFDDMLSNKEIRESFEKFYPVNPDNPSFELLGFDACLMASTEAVNEFAGIAQYYVASEEVEMDGWKNSKWVQEFADNPNWNGAQLGKAIIDAFMEKATQYTQLMGDSLVTNQLGLLDLSKTKDIYEAYGQLINQALKDSLTDSSVLTDFAKASQESIRYAVDAYNVYNTCDLGLFMDSLADTYPQAQKIRDMVDESLLYQRGIGQNSFSTGLSIHFPTEVTDVYSLYKALQYIDEISTEPAVRAFYYYKIAGCLSEEHQEYVTSQGWGRAPVIDTTKLKALNSMPVTVQANGSIAMDIPHDMYNMVQKSSLILVEYVEAANTMIYYGEDDYTHYNNGKLTTTFDGNWTSVNNVPLELKVISSDDKYIRYESDILLNGNVRSLILSYDRATKETVITGIRETSAPDILSRQVTILEKGDTITPLYNITEGKWADEMLTTGESTIYNPEKTEIAETPLEDGVYLQAILLQDFRGNQYVSSLVKFEMKDGKVVNPAVSNEFRTLN